MRKILFGIFLIILITAAILLIYYTLAKTAISFEGKTDDQILKEWIKTYPIVLTEAGEEKRATAADWLNEIRQYLLKDQKGKEIGYTTIDKIIISIKSDSKLKTTQNPIIPPALPPGPIPVPTPTPMPAPMPTPTPTPIPTPTPTPLPPTPTPAPNPTPTPTPTPNATPTPTPVAPVCGNNIVEPGEMCEPPNTATCDSNCQIIITPPPTPFPTHCTDSQWSGDESDLDCGGSCQKCPLPGQPTYLSCWDNNDCVTGNCQGVNLPAQDLNTGTWYTTPAQIRILTGQMWIIPYQGRCI